MTGVGHMVKQETLTLSKGVSYGQFRKADRQADENHDEHDDDDDGLDDHDGGRRNVHDNEIIIRRCQITRLFYCHRTG